MSFRLASLFDLSGKVALVTGGNSGLGLAMARGLGLAGATLVLAARRREELDASIRSFAEENIAAHGMPVDLALPDCATRITEALDHLKLSPDILVNAAGINLRQPYTDVTAEAFDLHMAVHLRAPFLLTQALAPAMKARAWGRIINVASLQSYRAFANSAPYGAAKAGVAQLTRATAEAWSQYGITCNAVAPGFFPTPLTAPVFNDPERSARNAAQTAIGRNGKLEDIMGAVVFLASGASEYVTGQVLAVDGGFTAK